MQDMFESLNRTIYDFNPEGGVTWSVAIEPLVAAMLPSTKDTNVLGLEPGQDGFSELIRFPRWHDTNVQSSRSPFCLVARFIGQFGCGSTSSIRSVRVGE